MFKIGSIHIRWVKSRTILCALMLPTLISCGMWAGRSDEIPIIDRGIIENKTPNAILNVKLRHLPTNAIAGLSSILPGSRLDMGMSPKGLLADEAILEWVEKEIHHQQRLTLSAPVSSDSSVRWTLIYTVLPDGQALVRFE